MPPVTAVPTPDGTPGGDTVVPLRGRIDRPPGGAADLDDDGCLDLAGWSAWGDRPALAVAAHLDGEPVGTVVVGNDYRPDVAEALGQPGLAVSGWQLRVGPLGPGTDGDRTLVVTAWGEAGSPPAELGRVVLRASGSAVAATAARAPAERERPPATSAVTRDEVDRLEVQAAIPTVMAWIAEAADVPEDLTVSVTVATRDRPGLLERAVASVLGQSYRRLELVVVDDSDGSDTADLLAGTADPRLRVVRTDRRRGASAAFNAGIEAATGDVVAFLDDDNLMHRDWLRSVVWAFSSFPEYSTLYGARVKEDGEGPRRLLADVLPVVEFARWDRAAYECGNFVDRNAVAFRASLADVRYDESLVAAMDWDHALRLFGRAEPLALPAIACFYRTTNHGRMSLEPAAAADVRRVRDRARNSRPVPGPGTTAR